MFIRAISRFTSLSGYLECFKVFSPSTFSPLVEGFYFGFAK
jgi:hypothetical protein